MMSSKEKKAKQGITITGHEWNGITEYNTPIPKIIWVSLIMTTIIAVIMWVLYPTWPLGNSYTKGVLGIDQKTDVSKRLDRSNQIREFWEVELLETSLTDIQENPDMMAIVRQNGERLFDDNCAMCHGSEAQGGDGYPDLTDDQWLWGGEVATILETINIGINDDSEDARFSQMMAFGQDDILSLKERNQVVAYVQSLLKGTTISDIDPVIVSAGADVFLDNCASCHGDDGKGDHTVGAPNLTDDFWLYGSDRASIARTINYGRQGVMPHWNERLTTAQRKILALYVYDLGEKER